MTDPIVVASSVEGGRTKDEIQEEEMMERMKKTAQLSIRSRERTQLAKLVLPMKTDEARKAFDEIESDIFKMLSPLFYKIYGSGIHGLEYMEQDHDNIVVYWTI